MYLKIVTATLPLLSSTSFGNNNNVIITLVFGPLTYAEPARVLDPPPNWRRVCLPSPSSWNFRRICGSFRLPCLLFLSSFPFIPCADSAQGLFASSCPMIEKNKKTPPPRGGYISLVKLCRILKPQPWQQRDFYPRGNFYPGTSLCCCEKKKKGIIPRPAVF